MTTTAKSVAEATMLLGRRDPSLGQILLYDCREDVPAVIEALQLHPSSSLHFVDVSANRLDDVAGRGLARFVETSSSVSMLLAYKNQFGEATHRAFAAALRVNASLRVLALFGSRPTVDERACDAAYVAAIAANPLQRDGQRKWQLYSMGDEYPRLCRQALDGHPSLQCVLLRLLLR